MGFMDSVSSFAQGVGQKAKGNYDVLALKNQASSLEKEVSELFKRLGEGYFNKYKEAPEAELAELVNQIIEKQNRIAELKAEAENTKAATAAVQLVPQQEATPKTFDAIPPIQASSGGITPISAQPVSSVGINPVPQQAAGKKCIKCGQVIGDDLFCGYCGARQEEIVPVEQVKVCINCGKPVGNELFCSYCGTKQVVEEAVVESVPEQRGSGEIISVDVEEMTGLPDPNVD